MPVPKKKKNVATKLLLSEVSAVDVPAMEGANADIRKSAHSWEAVLKQLWQLEGYQVYNEIDDKADLTTAVKNFMNVVGKDLPRIAEYIKMRAEKLSLTDELPDEGIVASFFKEDTTKGAKGNDMPKEEEDKEKKKKEEAMKKELDEAKAENARLAKVLDLSPVHKEYYDKLDPMIDSDVRKNFLDASAEKRTEIVEAAKAAEDAKNPVIYTADDGTKYYKNDDPRMVDLAKKFDASKKEAADARTAEYESQLSKRVQTEFKHLPGDEETRKNLVRGADSIKDEEARKKALDSLRAKDARNAPSFKSVGTSDPGIETTGDASDKEAADAQLETKARELMEKNAEMSYEEAYEKASDANPELLAKAMGY